MLSCHEYIHIGHGNSLVEHATDDRKVPGSNPALRNFDNFVDPTLPGSFGRDNKLLVGFFPALFQGK